MVMREHISRLMDGDLDDAECDLAFHELKGADGVAVWVSYHVIGDALRTQRRPDAGVRCTLRGATRCRADGPRADAAPGQASAARVGGRRFDFGGDGGRLGRGQYARSPIHDGGTCPRGGHGPQCPGNPQTVSPDYLLAHQEFSPTTQIQGVGPYLRSVSSGGRGRALMQSIAAR